MTSLILLGGGLANGLLALELLRSRPELDFTVIEAGTRLGGDHTWSFHHNDLAEAGHSLVAPLVSHRWSGQSVRFPHHRRNLPAPYYSIPSDRFAAHLAQRLGGRLRLNARAVEIGPRHVVIEGGERLEADSVIRADGIPRTDALAIRFQTFVGKELRFARPHGLCDPIIMDATTPQEGGYRFTYVLPFSSDTALVEDTAYEDGGRIDRPALERRIADYCGLQGWQPVETLREEEGVLPITLGGDIDRFWRETGGVPSIGLRGNFFHPVTGYSLPDAVRVAGLIARQRDFAAPALHDTVESCSKRLWRERSFLRALNRMLFLAGHPERRWQVMERFYRLPEDLIARFYAAELVTTDKLRLLAGKPPVPILGAINALLSDGRA
ncbi:MAG: lycopene beta-cyclase CrtY [Methylobacterium mesophilicum]|nr:lycopene beta-cyclase CrtY [Methylobacterium mesophilicum]